MAKKDAGKIPNSVKFKPTAAQLKTAPDRAIEILKLLKKEFPDAHCELVHKNPLQLLISTILSAQCTDQRVNMVTKDLFKKYRSARAFAEAEQSELENDIRSTGFFRNKTKNIIAACGDIVGKHKGKVPQTREELTDLPGVGRKTANVVLANAYGIPAVVTDTHVIRLSRLLGLSKNNDPVKLEYDLMELFPEADWADLSHLLIWHGRKTCIARRPHCLECVLRQHCAFGSE